MGCFCGPVFRTGLVTRRGLPSAAIDTVYPPSYCPSELRESFYTRHAEPC